MAFATKAASALAWVAGLGSDTAFLSPQQQPAARRQPALRTAAAAAQPQAAGEVGQGSAALRAGALVLAGVGAAAVATAKKRSRKSAGSANRASPAVVRQCALEYGEDLAVPDDAYIVLGLAHCFEQVDGKLEDVYVLEPVSASTVEVIVNGAQTSYETYVGTTVGAVMAQDLAAWPEALRDGREARFCDELEFRLGCAARTWMRDHARDVVRAMAPVGEVRTGFNTDTEHKRILNFVHEVKDSDNVKQDMSIDVYGRSEDEEGDDGVDSQIADLYNV